MSFKEYVSNKGLIWQENLDVQNSWKKKIDTIDVSRLIVDSLQLCLIWWECRKKLMKMSKLFKICAKKEREIGKCRLWLVAGAQLDG